MRVGLLQTQVPFVTGGAERHSANLCVALREHGHEVAEITLPFKWYPGETLVDSILAARLTDLSETEGVPTDLMIGLRFPAYLARHPNKVFWIIHQFRQAYDQWDTGVSELLEDPEGEAVRHLVRAEDRKAFAETAHPVYANSATVAQRLQTHLGQKATPLYHPPPNAGLLSQGPFGDYLFAPGRLNPSKRPELLLQALARTTPPLRLVIAGVAGNPAYLDRLRALADDLGVAGRVEWLGGIDDDTMRMTYANARAVVFVPQDEDYGYITLEAMLSGKPVITTGDAGGPLEFVTNGKHGLVCAPSPAALAEGFETVMQDRRLAERMGAAGHERYRKLDISWDHVVETLTGRSRPRDALRPAMMPGPAGGKEGTDQAEATRADAVSRLRAAIAPAQTPHVELPFQSMSDVLSAYDFETLPPAGDSRGDDPNTTPPDTGLAAYLDTHWTRFLTTLDMVVALDPETVLDVGVFPPLAFEAMMATALPGVQMHGVWEGPEPYYQKVRSRNDSLPDFDILLSPANIEQDRLPHESESFDLVLGMEIFEHLALDPYFFLSEACRVLKPGGHILLSTPNIVSHRGVWKTLNGQSAYSFGLFVPTGGVYGRHNREYAPLEVETLAKSAGFETDILKTVDVYDDAIDPGTAELLCARDDSLALRGETIFYVGRKIGIPTGVPAGFYHGDPERMSGALHVAGHDPQTGLVRVQVTNHSPSWWPQAEGYATCLLAEWVDPNGVLRHTNAFLPLTDTLGPGASLTIGLRLDAGTETAAPPTLGTLRLELFQKGVGRFSGTGRAKGITLPCSEDAFVRLVRRSA
ncbi:glycosyltransferase [Roseovarius nitratireducens]|uniref:glycosyltransferase n=1 Tax=Roseovarius nitratireducens TaxID=2044597 RepID=UPI000CE1B7DD|nr:glycosyltransferase [Roseovarius nitratireducens]